MATVKMWLQYGLVGLIFLLVILVTLAFIGWRDDHDFTAAFIIVVTVFVTYLYFSGSLHDHIRRGGLSCWLHLAIFIVFILIAIGFATLAYLRACNSEGTSDSGDLGHR